MPKKTYVKSDIVKTLQGHYQKIPNTDVERIVESIFKYLGNALSEGKNIEIRGLGTFKIKNMPERNARNPKTGEEVPITARSVVTFRASNVLKSKVNSKKKININIEDEIIKKTLIK